MRITITILSIAILVLICGCEQGLRFAPSENIKQTAELTNQLARKVNAEGTDPLSPASTKLVQGTQVALSYIGRPQEVPDESQFETITQQAQVEAEQRPDPWQVADSMLELGIGVCALLGGVYGTKAVKYLTTAKKKSTALQEIIQGNELFKKNATPEAIKAFADAQNEKQVSNGTKLVVAQTKLS